jgi:hypothetical protein
MQGAFTFIAVNPLVRMQLLILASTYHPAGMYLGFGRFSDYIILFSKHDPGFLWIRLSCSPLPV